MNQRARLKLLAHKVKKKDSGALKVKVSCCPCCSGKFPPIPGHFSNDLKELVEALIKKEPEARPSLQEILDLAYVRRHMQLYRDHVARHITERQTSFQRSLSQFNLEAMAQVCFFPTSLCVNITAS